MIDWPVNRNAIKVFKKSNLNTGELQTCIQVGDEENNFGVTFSDDVNPDIPIKMLMENICRKILGITEHDIFMALCDKIIKDTECITISG